MSHAGVRNSIPKGTLANHSVGAARPRSLIMETQKSASSRHEGKNPESELQTSQYSARRY